jgi:hypothetical protein
MKGKRTLTVGALAVLLISLGTTSVLASIPDSQGVIHACID